MKQIFVRAAGAFALLTIAAVAFGIPMSPPAAQADPANIMIINSSICTALTNPVITSACTVQPASGMRFGAALPGDQAMVVLSNTLGNNNDKIEESDFVDANTFTGGQIHQNDAAFATSLTNFAVIAFVKSVAPVTFHTTAGVWTESGSAIWTCDGTAALNPDSDCGGPNSTDTTIQPAGGGQPEYRLGPDRVVVAYLSCTLATCPELGEHELTVEQSGVVYPYKFTIVGEARSVKFFTLETAIQAGVPVSGELSHRSATSIPPCELPGCTPVATACPFSASLPFITKALGEAEKTVVVARALDIADTPISGAWINWTVDNGGTPTNPAAFAADGNSPTNFDGQGILSQTATPTLNLGGFGYGAPNILCAPAGAAAGKVTVRATVSRSVLGFTADPGADPGVAGDLIYGEVDFDVHAAPSKMTLAATPAEVPCDGTATTTLAATLTDAAGAVAIAGTKVHFDLQVLGTANPIDAVTNGEGVATTVITPVSGVARGLPVTVSVKVGGEVQPDLTQSILIRCSGAVAPGGTPPGGAPGTGSGGTSTGTISPPNTGGEIDAAGAGRLSWWPALVLAAAGAMLGGTRLAFSRKRS